MTAKPKRNIRLAWMFVIACLAFAAVFARLVHLQIFLHSSYSKKVAIQTSGNMKIKPPRGIIYDRNGLVVANNIVLQALSAYPTTNQEVEHVGKYLDSFFKMPPGTAKRKYNLRKNQYSPIQRKMDDETAERIAKDSPKGLHLSEEPHRVYPFGLIGKQILGFTNIDGKGLSGLELCYDSTLAGQVGTVAYRNDVFRNRFRINEQAIVKPVPGQSKILTIDWKMQEIVEEELKKGVEEFKAASGQAIFINNNNGEIIAMAHYDPNEKNREKPTKLRVITDQFEPGSVYKIIAAAGLLEDKLINYNDSIYCDTGYWKIDRNIIRDDKKHAWLNFRKIIELSSNIGIGKASLEYGGDRLYEFSKQFGIGQRLLGDWPSETPGRITNYDKWSDFATASLSMGHAVAVNALQMVSAMSVIANGGKLYKPRVVLCDVNEKGKPINLTKPIVLGEFLSEHTVDSLRAFLRGVVENGTATKVNSSVVTIAGKTGTAQIFDMNTRSYSLRDYMASFLGFFPAEEPLITGIVVLEKPQPIHYGGLTSGPIFKRIAERYTTNNPDLFAIPKQMLAESDEETIKTKVVPNLIGKNFASIENDVIEKKLNVRTNADSGYVVWQYPPADRLIVENDEILVSVENKNGKTMADLSGLTIREVSAYMQHLGITYSIKGNGRVYRQSVQPGVVIKEDLNCRLECKPI